MVIDFTNDVAKASFSFLVLGLDFKNKQGRQILTRELSKIKLKQKNGDRDYYRTS